MGPNYTAKRRHGGIDHNSLKISDIDARTALFFAPGVLILEEKRPGSRLYIYKVSDLYWMGLKGPGFVTHPPEGNLINKLIQ